jgi:membrane dipeptidase
VIADSFPVTSEAALMKLYDASLVFDLMPEKAILVRSAADLHTAKRTGRLGIILGTQGLACIGNNTRLIWVLYSLGIRHIQITYNERNALGCGCREPNDDGLTRFGQQVIEEMNRLGIVLDLSHGGLKTSLDAIEYSSQPSIFSHASVKALCDNPRNLTDEQIKAVAKKGGVVGLCPHSVFVEKERGKRPTVGDFIDHIDYIAQMVGIDHVGVGTDNLQYATHYTKLHNGGFSRTYPTFFGGYGLEEKHAKGFSQWSEWPNLTRQLMERGYSEKDTQKVLGGNFLRVFEKVWR